jgi:hypothetical protein
MKILKPMVDNEETAGDSTMTSLLVTWRVKSAGMIDDSF